MSEPRRIVIVGGSLAGVSFARSLRSHGYDQTITVVADETPYDRPPLSKAFLSGDLESDELALLGAEEDLRLDIVDGRAISLEPQTPAVGLADGRSIPGDVVVVASGAHARRLPARLDDPAVRTLRSLPDARGLRDALATAARLVVIGAGFIGCEIASTARARGVDVTLIDSAPAPLYGALGAEAGGWIGQLHRSRGVHLRCGAALTGISTAPGHQVRVHLEDGSRETGDVVVAAIGSAPTTAWLDGSGIERLPRDGAVVVDPVGRTSAPTVLAIGDVAAPPATDLGEHVRSEHWTAAVEQADRAARTLLGLDLSPSRPPYFWSDQFGLRVQYAGRHRSSDVPHVVEGTPGDGPFAVTWHGPEGTPPSAVLTVGSVRTFGRLRRTVQHAPA